MKPDKRVPIKATAISNAFVCLVELVRYQVKNTGLDFKYKVIVDQENEIVWVQKKKKRVSYETR